ncbi:glycerate kinase [Aquimarina sp. D1M17]|uniref:glycerate kinase n=1 Tax=Aquimarina acroporae TaxID=2937283 RepID=UPI0020BFB953|nr:glycerate kinase [Aquimarina acroporae]MCK8521269.1 glycerate kinase [Aquimarina acroporae]
MKIVLAPDKFKNSLSGIEFCEAVEAGIKKISPDAEIVQLPLADGGDGTIEVINYYLKGNFISVEVHNPHFKTIKASYLYSESSQTAFIEMAEASGVKLLENEQLNCKNATTYGTGEMILDAINNGAAKIILGLGGSATNDCGIGMASALGYEFLDKNNKPVIPIGANLSKIVSINSTHVNSKLRNVLFEIACDVSNPLYGKNGAAHVYAAQKGATPEDIEMLDQGLQDFSVVLGSVFQIDVQQIKGAGAAGGMGIASKVFLNGTLEPGIQLIKKLSNFSEKIEGAQWVISGEGKLDSQTLSGKTIQGVVTTAKQKDIAVALFCGAIDLPETTVKDFGVSYTASIMEQAVDFDDAMRNTNEYLQQIASSFAQKKMK